MIKISIFFKTIKRRAGRVLYRIHMRLKLKNKTFTLVSNDCVGGKLYHQLGLRFNSPTINLRIDDNDFLSFVCNLKDYLDSDILPICDEDVPYPVGLLKPNNSGIKPIKLYFVHYDSFEEAKQKWFLRLKRINFDNIYVLFDVTNDGVQGNDVFELWNDVDIKKIMLINKSKSNIFVSNDVFEIDFGKEHHHGQIFEPCGRGQFFNQFDFVKWLNGK